MEATEEETFNKIINAIQNMGETGATIDDLSQIVSLERHTLSKYLNRLRADGRLAYKRIGRAKVWFVSRAPLQSIFRLSEDEKTYTEKIFSHILSDIPEGVLVLDYDYNILFMNRYLIALYGDCVGQKYYLAFFDSPRESLVQSKIGEIIEGWSEEVESPVRDKEGRTLEIKARKTENPDGSFSIIAIITDVSERVRREERIEHLSELHRLIGESVNRAYTIDQLCSSILENLRDVIGYDMGEILIHNPDNNTLSSLAQIGYRRGEDLLGDNHHREIEEYKQSVATAAINRRALVFFEFDKKEKRKKTNELENELSRYAYNLAEAYNLQAVYAVPLKTKGELHGALLILTKHGRTLSEEDRSLLEGVSEGIAGGIAKIKLEEELRLKANAIEISINPVLMANMGGKLTYVNPAFLKMWGYDREKEVLGQPCTEFWKAKDILTTVQKKGNWEGELIGVRKDGSESNARLSASLIIGKKGPLQFVAVAETFFRKESVIKK
jgi:PAS domain S-box-containing protein